MVCTKIRSSPLPMLFMFSQVLLNSNTFYKSLKMRVLHTKMISFICLWRSRWKGCLFRIFLIVIQCYVIIVCIEGWNFHFPSIDAHVCCVANPWQFYYFPFSRKNELALAEIQKLPAHTMRGVKREKAIRNVSYISSQPLHITTIFINNWEDVFATYVHKI